MLGIKFFDFEIKTILKNLFFFFKNKFTNIIFSSNIFYFSKKIKKKILFLNSYYNYKNLVLYLLKKGCDPYKSDKQGQNIFHLVCFYGRFDCLSLILNYERHLERVKLTILVKELMKEYKFKRTDINDGILVSPDKHMLKIQNKFNEFNEKIEEIYKDYIENLITKFQKNIMAGLDFNNRNPLHYASFSKFTKFF